MQFPSKTGCPMCGIVQKAIHHAPNSPLFSPATGVPHIQRRSEPEILWQDNNFTVYRENAHPVSSCVHLVVLFNLHVPSLYALSTSDVPLLISLRALAHRFLASYTIQRHNPPSTAVPLVSPSSPAFPRATTSSVTVPLSNDPNNSHSHFRVGFITPLWKDSCIPVKDHLHAHAYIAPADLCGWWRSVVYSSLAWYAIEDLIAEIREESTNNRIKSGYANRGLSPIDVVPAAGARSGTANGIETTCPGLSAETTVDEDLEAGQGLPRQAREGASPPR